MPIYELQTPEGKLLQVEAPDINSAHDAVQQKYAPPTDPNTYAGNVGRGIVRGARDPLDAGAQLLTRGLEGVAPEGSWFHKFMTGQRELVERLNNEGEADYQKNWQPDAPGAGFGRVAGNVLATAPVAMAMPGAAAEGLGARTLSGLASGAVTGALEPVKGQPSSDEFWAKKIGQAGAGAAGGAVAPAVFGAASRVVLPNTAPEVRALMDEGVRPTPGQILGKTANRIEEGMQSIPFVGDVIKGARTRGVEDFNRAAINRSLEPIGEKLSPAAGVGREALTEAKDKIGAAYDRLLPQLKVQADPQFVGGMQNILSMSSSLEPGMDTQFRNILTNKLMSKFAPNGRMTGEGFKEVESEFGRLAKNYSTSAVASERELGGAFKQVQAEMRDMLMRSNPDHANELKSINNAFANYLRVENAGSRLGGEQGVFTPAQLLNSTRTLDPSMRKGSFARGDALMQDLAESGKAVMGSKLPDSGTPYRAYIGLPALMAASHADPTGLSVLPAMGAAGVGAAYTKPGVALLEALLARRPPGAQTAGSILRTPATTPLAAIMAQQPGNQ